MSNPPGVTRDPPSIQSADELLRQYQQGATSVHTHVRRVARRAVESRLRGIGTEEQADLVSETVQQVWRATSRPSFNLRSSLDAFVRCVAAARCIDWLRTQRRTQQLPDDLIDPGPSPPEEARRHHQRLRLNRAMARLPRECQELLRLRFEDEVPFSKLADRFQTSSVTIRSRLTASVVKLRKILRHMDRER